MATLQGEQEDKMPQEKLKKDIKLILGKGITDLRKFIFTMRMDTLAQPQRQHMTRCLKRRNDHNGSVAQASN
jgi:hypothetical protein